MRDRIALWIGYGFIMAIFLGWQIFKWHPKHLLRPFEAPGLYRHFWLKWLSMHGAVRLSLMPVLDRRTFPLEECRRLGLIEHDASEDPLIQLSGYGRLMFYQPSR